MVNKKVKTAMFEQERTHKDMANKIGINARVFTNKINRRMVNGYESKFSLAEKVLLAAELGLKPEDIE